MIVIKKCMLKELGKWRQDKSVCWSNCEIINNVNSFWIPFPQLRRENCCYNINTSLHEVLIVKIFKSYSINMFKSYIAFAFDTKCVTQKQHTFYQTYHF